MESTSTNVKSTHSFIQLNNANWDTYKFQSRTYFFEVEGLHIIEKGMPPPDDKSERESSSSSSLSSSVPETRKSYDDKVRKMYIYLVRTMSDETRPLVRNITMGDAISCWKAICDVFESKTMASIKQITSQLIRCSYGSPSYRPGAAISVLLKSQ